MRPLNLKSSLYEKLPTIYRDCDNVVSQSNPYPLKRYLEVLGGGFDELERYLQDFNNLRDVDKCPKDLLPNFAKMYGLDFPYDMDEQTQRKFLKVLPILYTKKGTEDAFKFLAREIFGEGTNLKATMAQKPPDTTEEDWRKSGDWNKIFVYLETNGEGFMLANKEHNFKKFSEIIRPVNTRVIPHLALFYQDIYLRDKLCNDTLQTDTIFQNWTENYDSKKLKDEDLPPKLFINESEEQYKSQNIKEESYELIRLDDGVDTRVGIITDSFTDRIISVDTLEERRTQKTTESANTIIHATRAFALLGVSGKINTTFIASDIVPAKDELDY